MGGSRVKEFRLPMTAVFGGSALFGLLLCAVLGLAGVELGLNLTLVGLFLGLLVPIGIEIRSRTGRARRVVIIDYRTHQYGHAVGRGAIRTLTADKRNWTVTHTGPPSTTDMDAITWQIHAVQSAVLEDADGIILIPAGDDESLWFALASAIKARMFVVVVDTKPPNRVFRDVGIEPPRFVSTKYADTGTIVGETMINWLRADATRRGVVWVGPYGSWPGEERSRNVIFEFAKNGLLDRAILLPIASWSPDAKRCRETLDYIDDLGCEMAVYTADDENAVALHLLTLTERPALRQRMYIVGCNGTPDDWGNVQCVDMRAVDATVDILAEEQGVQAAMLFVKERNARLDPSERTVFIRPQVMYATTSGKRWVDELFSARGSKPSLNGTGAGMNPGDAPSVGHAVK